MKLLKSVLIISLLFCGVVAAKNTLESYSVGTIKDGVLHVNAVEAAAILDQHAEVIVLDVRTVKEHADQNIQVGLNIDYYGDDFKQQLSTLDKTQTYLVHCKTGVRSGRTLPIMQELGFTHLMHLDGGIRAWKALGE